MAGLSGSYSDSGEWTVGRDLGVGYGSAVGGWGGRSETEALTHDEAVDAWELMWQLSNPIAPLDPGDLWGR